MRSRIDMAVALPGVVELCVAVAAARLRRALLALRAGIDGVSSLAVVGFHCGYRFVRGLERHRVFA